MTYHYYGIESKISDKHTLLVTNEGGDRKYPKYIYIKLINNLESLFSIQIIFEKRKEQKMEKEKENIKTKINGEMRANVSLEEIINFITNSMEKNKYN